REARFHEGGPPQARGLQARALDRRGLLAARALTPSLLATPRAICLCCPGHIAAATEGRTMNIRSNKLALLGSLLLPLFVASCGGGGAATEDDSPEAAAFHYRDGVMQSISWKMTRIGGMAAGEIPANNDTFRKDARDLAALAGMLPEGFIPNSIV